MEPVSVGFKLVTEGLTSAIFLSVTEFGPYKCLLMQLFYFNIWDIKLLDTQYLF
jgi:hypothetical protein